MAERSFQERGRFNLHFMFLALRIPFFTGLVFIKFSACVTFRKTLLANFSVLYNSISFTETSMSDTMLGHDML